MTVSPESYSITVRIYNQEYPLRTNGDPERLKAVCALLDAQMNEVARATGEMDQLKIAVLAALNIADEVYRAREEIRKLDDAIGKRSLACATLLDRNL